MVRDHESSIAWKSGLFALMVHIILLSALIFSFNWKAAHTVVAVSEVELWNELPNTSKPPPKPKPKVTPEPKPKVEPKVEEPEVEKPKVEEPEIEEPKAEEAKPKVDIALEKKKKEAEKLAEQKKKEAEKLAEKKKKEEAEQKKKLAELQKKVLEETETKEEDEVLKKLQAQMLDENAKPTAAVNQGVVNEYMARIQAKIRGNVNKRLCGEGNPELVFKVNLLPNGEFVSNPRLTESSGNAACDRAVEAAIIASEPLPLPSDPDALAQFRNLNLKFKPNGD